jgi:hypothetical protein
VLPVKGDFMKCVRTLSKDAHAATTDKAEHAFAVIGIYPYRPNIIL